MGVSRRSFIKGAATTAAVSMAGGALKPVIGADSELKPGPGNKWPGRVVVNFNKDAVSGSTVDEAVAKTMVDDSIMLLTGKESVGTAWKAVFPDSLSASSKIAIKTNILNAGLPCPHASTVQAITEGLLQMDLDGASLPAANITIYDGNNSNALSKAGYTSDRFPGINLVKESSFTKFGNGALDDRAYAETLHEADFLINVFSPRGHFIGSGVTLGFKSHFGTYTTPSGLHTDIDSGLSRTRFGGGYTDGGSNNIAEINSVGPVYEKTVLSFCSGLFGMDRGNGPTGSADFFGLYASGIDASIDSSDSVCPTTIIMSTDPVSCDMQAFKLLQMNQSGGTYGIDDMPSYLRIATGLTGRSFNIGVINEEEMVIGKIINGEVISTGTMPRKSAVLSAPKQDLTVTVSRGSRTAFIEYSVRQQMIGKKARVEIFDIHGKVVYRKSQIIRGAVNHLSWNMRTSSGVAVANGNYVIRVSAGSYFRSCALVAQR